MTTTVGCVVHPSRYRWQVRRWNIVDGPCAGEHRWASYKANTTVGSPPSGELPAGYVSDFTVHFTHEEAIQATDSKVRRSA